MQVTDPALRELLERMTAARQLSVADARMLSEAPVGPDGPITTEDQVLRWLAHEYGLGFTALDDREPEKEVLSLFPARLLLKEELLPLRRINGAVEIATSRLFATQGLDAPKTMTGLRRQLVLAPAEGIPRGLNDPLAAGADHSDPRG